MVHLTVGIFEFNRITPASVIVALGEASETLPIEGGEVFPNTADKDRAAVTGAAVEVLIAVPAIATAVRTRTV